jgi:membrane-bound lytic murein transglycosylase D
VESADAFRESLLLLTPDQRLRVERYQIREGDTVTALAARFGTTAQHLRELNSLGNADTVTLGSELRVPSSVSALPENVLKAAARVDARGRARTVQAVHVVRRGDSLWSIAKRHNLDVVQLANLNRIDPNDGLRPGQRLKLSVTSGGSASGGGSAAGASGKRVTYVVRSGDTLSTIAQTLKVSVANLRDWNSIAGNKIRAGQKLVAYVRRGS